MLTTAMFTTAVNLLVRYLPAKVSQERASAPRSPPLCARRVVRAHVGDAAAPSRWRTCSASGEGRAGRSSAPSRPCYCAMAGVGAQGTWAACAARARPLREGPSPRAKVQRDSFASTHHRAQPTRRLPLRPRAARSSQPLLHDEGQGTAAGVGQGRVARIVLVEAARVHPSGQPHPAHHARPTRRVPHHRRR